MTVANIARKSGPFAGDNITVTFSFAFRILTADELAVYVDAILQSPSTYTVQGVNQDSGGSVTFALPPVGGAIIWLFGNTIKQQPTSYPPNGAFPSVSHETGLDRPMMVVWEQFEAQERVPRFDPSTLPNLRNMVLPQPVPLKLWSWNSTGDEVVYVNSAILTVEPIVGGGARVEAQASVEVPSVDNSSVLTAVGLVPAGAGLTALLVYNHVAFGTSRNLTGYSVGTASGPQRYGQGIPVTLAAQNSRGTFLDYVEESANNPIDAILTAEGGFFDTAGVAIVTAVYTIFVPPTSV